MGFIKLSTYMKMLVCIKEIAIIFKMEDDWVKIIKASPRLCKGCDDCLLRQVGRFLTEIESKTSITTNPYKPLTYSLKRLEWSTSLE